MVLSFWLPSTRISANLYLNFFLPKLAIDINTLLEGVCPPSPYHVTWPIYRLPPTSILSVCNIFHHTRLSLQTRLSDWSTCSNRCAYLPTNSTISDLPRLSIKKKEYVLREWLDEKRISTSFIHEHGRLLTKINKEGLKIDTYWFCSLCDNREKETAFNALTTSNAIKHLKQAHGICRPRDNDDKSNPTVVDNVYEMQKNNASRKVVISRTLGESESSLKRSF